MDSETADYPAELDLFNVAGGSFLSKGALGVSVARGLAAQGANPPVSGAHWENLTALGAELVYPEHVARSYGKGFDGRDIAGRDIETRSAWFANRCSFRFLIFLAALSLISGTANALSVGDARHLLTRTGFGASPEEIAALSPLSREQAVERVLLTLRQQPSTPPPAFVNENRPDYWQGDWHGRSNITFRENEMAQLRAWWLAEMVNTPSPFTERMVVFWHGRFVSRYSAVVITAPLFDQLELFRRYQGGNYRSLILAILHDPMMLSYLDNVENSRTHPNENLARELLELFTLGPGNYSEGDIKQLARVLAGHHVQYEKGWTYHVDPEAVDPGEKVFLGSAISGTPGQQLEEVVDTILAQKAAPRFLARKLYEEFVSIDVDPVEVERLSQVFANNRFELKPLYRALLLSDAFWSDRNRGSLIKSPTDLIVGFVRTFKVNIPDYQALSDYSTALGQTLFDPPTVAGWPGGQDWISTDTLTTRRRVMTRLWAAVDVATREDPDPSLPGIRLRFSSEQRAAPATLRITINDKKAWTVTARHGNSLKAEASSSDPNNLKPAWETFVIPVSALPAKIAKIDVTLVDPDIDTNAFVNWISLPDRRLTPRDGHWSHTPTPECGRDAPVGMFYCGGTLTFNTLAATGSSASDRNAPLNSQIEYATARAPVAFNRASQPVTWINSEGLLAGPLMIASPLQENGESRQDFVRRLTLDPSYNLK